MSEDSAESLLPQETTEVPRWILPTRGIVERRSKEVFNGRDGKRVGEVIQLKSRVEEGAQTATIEIKLKEVNARDYVVNTSGWHTWSGRETRGKQVGRSSISERLGGRKTTFVVEPGSGGEKIAEGEGVSYGWLNFRKRDGSENIAVGVIPTFDAVEDIRFRQEGSDMVVSVRKDLQGAVGKERTFKMFLGKGNYQELTDSFSKELEGLVGEVKTMKDRIIWFSWAAYGKGVTQADIEGEIEAAKEVGIDTMIIDDGWQIVNGQWEVKTQKFPDMIGLVGRIKEAGIKPGIWIAPFMTMRESEVYRLYPEWLMVGEGGKELNVSNPQIQPTGELRPVAEKALGLDVSVSEAREHLYGEFVRLAKMGFDVFKVDFISIPFIGSLKNKDKTAVEYYRQFWQEVRQRVKIEAGKEIELIGCGAPMMESIGLFEGMRVSPDSAMPNLETLPVYGGALSWLKEKPYFGEALVKIFGRLDEVMYREAAAVAFRRALVFGRPHGLLVDGVHLNDPKVHVPEDLRRKIALALPALKKLGAITNLFVGDSLARSGEGGRRQWRKFLDRFKQGAVSKEPLGL